MADGVPGLPHPELLAPGSTVVGYQAAGRSDPVYFAPVRVQEAVMKKSNQTQWVIAIIIAAVLLSPWGQRNILSRLGVNTG